VKHPQSLIAVNYISDRPKSRIERLRLGCDYVCGFVQVLNCDFSVHTLVLVIFYCVSLVYDIYCGVAGIKNVKKRHFGVVGG